MAVNRFRQSEQPAVRSHRARAAKLGVRYVAIDLTQNPSTFEQIKTPDLSEPVVISPTRP